MSNLTITNESTAGVKIQDNVFEDYVLNLSAAQTLSAGTIIAADSVSGKRVLFVPGGSAAQTTSAATFNLNAGDTLVLDVNNVGNATATWDATAATITDTTTYPVADQDGLTALVTLTGGPYDGEVQTVTFSGATTTAAGVAAQMNSQLKGCSATVTGGQVVLTTDTAGTDMDIATGAGTGGLTWGASTAGTGDVGDIDAITATEIKTVVEADTTATATVNADNTVTIKATEELEIVSGNAVTKLGLTTGVTTANGNGVPKNILTYDLEGASGDNQVRLLKSGEVRQDQLVIADGSTVTQAIGDQLRDYSMIDVVVTDLSILDNQ